MLNVKEIIGPIIYGRGSFSGWPSVRIEFDNNIEGMYLSINKIVSDVMRIAKNNRYLIVLTGKEPLQQKHIYLKELAIRLRDYKLPVLLETTGAVAGEGIFNEIDYIVCSPRAPFDELKIIKEIVNCWILPYPHKLIDIAPFIELSKKSMQNNYSFPARTFYVESAEKVIDLGLPWKMSVSITYKEDKND